MDRDDDLSTFENLGLALGGGGALGAAHVGVLQVLHERGIRPTIVAGTSAGSIAGGAYALGMDVYDMEERVCRASWKTFGRWSKTPGLGFLTADALRERVQNIAGEVTIEELPMRFAAVATALDTREPEALTSGPLAEAVAASIAVPGVFRPVKRGSRTLIDGGVMQNLPIETAFDLGANHVIAVRLAPEVDSPGFESSTIGVHEWAIRPDVTLIHPRLGGRSQWRTKDLRGLVQLGREAAERALAEYPVVIQRPATPPAPEA